MILETKYPVGGLNADDAYSVLAIEDYQNAENIRVIVSEDGKVGVIKNVPGNTAVSNPEYIAGTCIGSVEDREKSRCYYFVYNESGNHRIFCYRYEENDILLMFKGEDIVEIPPNKGLLWDGSPITGVAVVGDTLYWTDNTSPRKINTERFLASYNVGYPGEGYATTNWNDEDITIIRPQPILPLSIEKLVSEDQPDIDDRANNFIAEEAFQFSCRYIYNDDEPSALSVYSELANYNDDDGTIDYDTIRVMVSPYQIIPKGVKKVQILYRNGNTGSFSIVKEFDAADHSILTPLTFDFFNEKNGNQIADETAYKLFDDVPIVSKALESARNRIFLGNNTFGYDPLESLDIQVSIDSVEAGGTPDIGTYFYVSQVAYNPGSPAVNSVAKEVVLVLISGGPNDGYYLTDMIADYPSSYGSTIIPDSFLDDFVDGNLPVTITVSPSANILPSTASDAEIFAALMEYPAGWSLGTRVNRTYTGVSPLIYGLSGTPIEGGYRQWKRASKYRFGIVFYDNYGRNNGVYTNDNMLFVTPDRIYNQTIYNGNAVWTINDDGSSIPEWATHYQIVRTKNLFISFFLQHFTRNPQYVSKDDDGNYVFGGTFDSETTIGLAFDISRIDNDGLGYTFAEGDVLKFYASDDTDPERLNIFDQQGKYVITEPVNLGDLADTGNAKTVGVIEIFTPAKDEDIFYEIGKVYRVQLPRTDYRSFSIKSGSVSGDTYIKVRTIAGEGDLAMEAMNINDRHWQEWLTDVGRPNIILYDTGREVRPTNICYSETFVQGTKVNGLSSFNTLDQRDLDEQTGSIQKLILTSRTQEYGSVMLAISTQETSSIYLGERQVVDNASTALLATSGEVIGTINSLKGGYGTINPESVAELEGQVFFFDAYNGKVVRYTLNGLDPISEVKMSNFFSEIGKAYLVNREGYFPGTIDPFSHEYLISIPQLSTPTREYLESTEVLYDDSNKSPLTEFDPGIVVSEGDKFKIQGSSNLGALPATIRVYLANSVGRDQELVYEASGVGEEEEFVASKAGIFLVTTVAPSYLSIEKFTNSPHSVFDGTSKCAVWNTKASRWTDFRTFVPDYFGLAPNLLLSFKDGALYRHDSLTKNNFYGVQYDSLVSFVFNQYPVPVKTLRFLHIRGNTSPYAHFRTEEYNIQSSDLLATEFRVREGSRQGAVLRDKLSPNVDEDKALIAGDTMKGQFPQVSMSWTQSGDLEVYLVTLGYVPSSGHPMSQK